MENVEFKKIKQTKGAGLEIKYTQTHDKDGIITSTDHTVESKGAEPSPDFKEALQKFQEIVRYDEGYTTKVEVEVTGVSYFPSNEAFVITHVKSINSGRTARNSGRISLNSESFSKTSELLEAWNRLVLETKAYLFEGKRAQLSMAFVEDAA